MQLPRCYVLTVDALDGERRQNARRQLSALGIDFEFIEGVKSGDPVLAEAYSGGLNLLLAKRSLSRAEIAIYEGHRRIWRKLRSDGHPAGLVVEDDFEIVDIAALQAAIGDILAADEPWDIVKFFDFRPKRTIAARQLHQARLVAHKYPASGAVAYLITAQAAGRLLNRKRVFRPVDEDFSHWWEFDLRIWSTEPNLVREISGELGGSLTEPERRSVRRNRLRSIWGNVLAVYKQVFAAIHRRR